MNTDIYPVPHSLTELTGGFWYDWFHLNAEKTIDAVYEQFEKTGRIEAMKLKWKEGDSYKPHIFYDSDMAKWAESASYALHWVNRPDWEEKIDNLVDIIESGRDEKGYFNCWYLQFDRGQRWTHRENHELYCAGHLLEAAIAYADATGKCRFLELMTDYADYIYKVFYVEKSASFTTPGHEEIELALMKLYRHSGKKKYLDLASFFINNRGEGKDPEDCLWYGKEYNQSHLPVREQTEARGHVVRFGYLFAAVADLARAQNDDTLFKACERVLDDVRNKKMYVTGGVGNLNHGESFGSPFVLPNKEAYTETCASISLILVYHRMLLLDPRSEYADLMELQLYNGMLAGISLDGVSFTYENPLEVFYKDTRFKESVKAPVRPFERQKVFSCSCCPPNISRILSSLGGYLYTRSDNTLWSHIFTSNRTTVPMAGGELTIEQKTDYPRSGHIEYAVLPKDCGEFTLAFRIPGWTDRFNLTLNGHVVTSRMEKGYALITRKWEERDKVILNVSLSPKELECHPLVAENAGKSALQYGPLIYCAEEVDNEERLWDYVIKKDPGYALATGDGPGGLPFITARALLRKNDFPLRGLYRPLQSRYEESELKLIPYYAWGNRRPGNMCVWIHKKERLT